MSRVLCLDVDSTIWRMESVFSSVVYEATGIHYNYENMPHWDHFHQTVGHERANRTFDLVLHPERMSERELYPGVAEALQEIHQSGIELHFITHNPNPDLVRVPLVRWLNYHLDIPFGLSVTATGRKLKIMRRRGSFGIIDDRPDFIEKVADAGLWAATKIHPWNQEVVERRGDIHGFEDWSEVPQLISNSEKEILC